MLSFLAKAVQNNANIEGKKVSKVVFTRRYTWQNFGTRLLRLVNQKFAMCNAR